MSQVTALIDLIAQGKNAEASELLNQELLTRSYQAVNDITPEVANNYFAPVVDMSGDGVVSYEESPTEEEPSE